MGNWSSWGTQANNVFSHQSEAKSSGLRLTQTLELPRQRLSIAEDEKQQSQLDTGAAPAKKKRKRMRKSASHQKVVCHVKLWLHEQYQETFILHACLPARTNVCAFSGGHPLLACWQDQSQAPGYSYILVFVSSIHPHKCLTSIQAYLICVLLLVDDVWNPRPTQDTGVNTRANCVHNHQHIGP